MELIVDPIFFYETFGVIKTLKLLPIKVAEALTKVSAPYIFC